MLQLAERADALIEGFRPGVAERLGLGPKDCAARNQKLVYGRVTGWGQQGPLSHAAGHDLNYIALTGALLFTCVWAGFLGLGNYFCYWFCHEAGQNTHYQMTLWGMANMIFLAAI